MTFWNKNHYTHSNGSNIQPWCNYLNFVLRQNLLFKFSANLQQLKLSEGNKQLICWCNFIYRFESITKHRFSSCSHLPASSKRNRKWYSDVDIVLRLRLAGNLILSETPLMGNLTKGMLVVNIIRSWQRVFLTRPPKQYS